MRNNFSRSQKAVILHYSRQSKNNIKKIYNMKIDYNYYEQDKQISEQQFTFTYDTDAELMQHEMTGYVDWYDMVRACITYKNGGSIDFPIRTRESYDAFIQNTDPSEIIEVYASKHYYDINDYE